MASKKVPLVWDEQGAQALRDLAASNGGKLPGRCNDATKDALADKAGLPAASRGGWHAQDRREVVTNQLRLARIVEKAARPRRSLRQSLRRLPRPQHGT